jgi:uncharacterized protein YqjF (DUF2071 family)
MSFLQNHPFAVASHFDTSLVLTYAAPKQQLEKLIPPCLSLDTFEDQWAFLAVAMVNTKALRPKGFPKMLGNDFILTGYRIFVRYHTSYGKSLRGLYIIRSETDKARMAVLGNVFTHYNYQTTDISFQRLGETIEVNSSKSKVKVRVREGSDVALPEHSPFKDWTEARRFVGPLPFTFTYNEPKKEVLIIEGVREDWTPKPVEILESRIGFIDGLGLSDVVLANAFAVHDIPYYWRKGRKDLWTP